MELSSLTTGTVIDRYVIDRVIGEGGMATVLLVRHSLLGSVHALKILTVSSSGIRERLRQEGRVQAALSHPNVVTVTDVIDLGGNPGLIMEYVDGPTLDTLIHSRQLGIAEVDEIVRGMLAGVAEAHRHGLVHRDLKPANVLLKTVDGVLVPKVADFGLAKVLHSGDSGGGRTRTGSTMGTPHYMSPEQVRDSKSVGPRSDLFALGCILYELVTGRRAFDGPDLLEIFNRVATGAYLPPRELVPDLPVRMERAIVSALQVDPEQRPASVEALAAIWSGSDGSSAPALPRVSLPRDFDAPSVKVARTFDADTLPEVPSSERPAVLVSNSTFSGTMPPRKAALVVGAFGGVVLSALVLGALVLIAVGGALWLSSSSEAPVPVVEPLKPVPLVPAPSPLEPPVPVTIPEVPAPSGSVPSPHPPVNGTPSIAPITVPAPAVAVPVPTVGPIPAPAAAPVAPAPAPAAPAAPATKYELSGRQTDPDPSERVKAAEALGRRSDHESVEDLALMLKDDDSTVRQAVVTAIVTRFLARNGDTDRLEGMLAGIASRGPSKQASAAVSALGRYGSPDSLKGALHHSSADVREDAIAALPGVLQRTGGGLAEFEQATRGLDQDPDEGVRRKLAKVRAQLH